MIRTASVKVMRSYDYCHFEVVLSADIYPVLPYEGALEQIDDLRKEAARLADKAVHQYKQAKAWREDLWSREDAKRRAEIAMKIVREVPESEWTPEQKATDKA